MRILIVEHDANYASQLTKRIEACCPAGAEVVHAPTRDRASDLIESRFFDVCFVEYQLEAPADGFDVLRHHHRTATLTAFVVLTNHASKELAFEALSLGAMDYLLKSNVSDFDLAKCVSYSMYLKHREVSYQTQALKDTLTGLGNRNLFDAQIEQAAQRARRDDEKLGLLLIDLDRFKSLNDRYGHQFGDAVLRQVAERIVRETRASDVLARIGGDEFAAILIRPKSVDHVHMVAEKIEKALTSMPYAIDGKAIKIGASVGGAVLPDDTRDIDKLFKLADTRMYKRKDVNRLKYAKSRDYIDAVLH